ncbi:terminase [Corynebacterium diphtheriae]|uniref:terminase n=1 Tax=Corynebacterium diphtheriae TaxID=1717 RepID=UPI0008FB3301|nr:terminase [Corynebacterium diphtheriae]OIR92176.1 terminase [Corynebacterium diphtheriae]OIR96060.1 terminase [Corynebacterium diphtheriae]OIR98053.1 terminase [Corynebacterium diphtheriae]
MKLNIGAGELDDNGKFRYHTVLASVPRQSGKTAGFMCTAIERTLTNREARVWYTAQSGAAARERWIKEAARPVDAKLHGLFRIKYGAGDTRMRIPATDAEFRPMPPTAQYLHGEQADFLGIDEPWAHSEAEGRALLQAVIPTMATREDKGRGTQLWYFSTKGTAASTWWHNMLDDAINNPKSGVFVADYGIAPDVDPTDIEAVIAAHPGVHGGLIAPQAVYKAADKLSPAEFARGYGNVATTTHSPLFDMRRIDAIETDDPLDAGPVHIGIAVAWDRSLSAIVAAGRIAETPAIEVIAARPGESWLTDAIDKIAARDDIASISIDSHGPASSIAEHLIAARDDITAIGPDDLVIGTEKLMTAVESDPPALALRRDTGLRDELPALKLRYLGDRGRLISRRQSQGPIPRIEAAVLALRRLEAVQEAKMPAPMIWSL